jgi:glutaredoxin-like YruB-family protein
MVKIYSTSGCPWCQKTKAYLDSKGVAYEDINVDENLEGRKEFLALTRSGSLPTLDINGNIVVGFDREKLDEYLDI